jgi:hypothetical protein
VIQGSVVGGQPKWSSSVEPKIAPSAFQARIAAVQRHAAGGAFAVDAQALGIESGGRKPLPDAVRGKMENALGPI